LDAYESWQLHDGQRLYLFHDKEKVRHVQLSRLDGDHADPGQECLRLLRPGTPMDVAHRIVVTSVPNATPHRNLTTFGVTGGRSHALEDWLIDAHPFLTIWYSGDVVSEVLCHGPEKRASAPPQE
jgi:hypothetical protein